MNIYDVIRKLSCAVVARLSLDPDFEKAAMIAKDAYVQIYAYMQHEQVSTKALEMTLALLQNPNVPVPPYSDIKFVYRFFVDELPFE